MKKDVLSPHDHPRTAAETLTYADLIIEYLVRIEVDYIFGVPGGAIEPLFNAVARYERKLLQRSRATERGEELHPLKMIVARHEAGAAFMADGYTRETGKLGVCCATTGPGATNLITGVASAFTDRIPMLVITPQTALPNFGKLALQESSGDLVDIVGMFAHCTKYNTFVSHQQQLEGKLYTALMYAFRPPYGPVHLSIPMDILNSQCDITGQRYQITHLPNTPRTYDYAAYDDLRQAFTQSRKFVLVVGGGCGNAMKEMMSFAERYQTPIVSTPSGKKWVNAYHPLYRGVFGFAGHQSARDTLTDARVDLILAVGTTLSELSTGGWSNDLLNCKLVHISSVPDDFTRSPMAKMHLVGDIQAIFKGLSERRVHSIFEGRDRRSPLIETHDVNHELENYVPKHIEIADKEKCDASTCPLKPQRVMKELTQRFPYETRFIVDAGNAWSWVTHYLFQHSTGNQRIGFGFGAMGWAIGAAIGTRLGNPVPTVCITGDGSYLMSGQEITTAVQHRLPIVFVILNDQALGMVKHGQRLGNAEAIGYELPPVDFALVASAMGARGIAIRTPDDLATLDIESILNDHKPTLLDIYIDPEETPPMRSRVKVLNRDR